jgi:hypothetical protein
MKPNKIIWNLTRTNNENAATPDYIPLKIPLLKDLYNFLQTQRKDIYGKPNMHLGELATWCLLHNVIPEETTLDQPFVVDYNIFFPDDDTENRRGEWETQDDKFRLFVSTRRLLALDPLEVLNADGTYRVNFDGHPMLILGTSDCGRVFHPFGLATTSREAHLDFKFLFNSWVLGRELIGLNAQQLTEKPISLMADAAAAITNGFNESRLKMNVRGNSKIRYNFKQRNVFSFYHVFMFFSQKVCAGFTVKMLPTNSLIESVIKPKKQNSTLLSLYFN